MEDLQIEDYLNRLSDSDDDGFTSQQRDEDLSDVEDHVELQETIPTDSDSDDDDQPIGIRQMQRRSGIILSSDSENEETSGTSFHSTPSRRIIIPSTHNLRGKNGHKWSSKPFESLNTRTPARNIVHIIQGTANNAKDIIEPVDCFSIFITADLIRKILTHTNEEIELRSSKYKESIATISLTCEEELTALLGLLLLSAAKKDNHLTSLELFDPTFSGSRYISVMSRERFDFLLNCLRFDDKSTRNERKAQDKFAPIRDLWEVFIQICRDSYKAGSYITIDEQLLGFRGRCPFRMYIPDVYSNSIKT
ncbi:unnamed protein product [Arctia plantaginis]|uniref:PiggyBac transposable element-derived protein domain-containing protein n=1 Tax=Arctia plantaginis TaxID=874455 RepID=A0A8S1BQU7_ARCPL|nr:unnamed protein product [Arctia plantaginis]